MTKDFAVALVLALIGSTTLACSSSSKDKDDKDGGGTGGTGGGAGGAFGSGGAAPDGGGSGGASGTGGAVGGASGRGGASGASGTGGAAGDAGASGSGGGPTHTCPPTMSPEECTGDTDCCGFAMGDALCVETGVTQFPQVCAATCTTGEDCASSCCAAVEGATLKACGPGENCGCGGVLDTCANNGACCGFQYGRNVCVDTGPSPAPGQVCLEVCKTNADCPAAGTGSNLNCCTELDATTSVCTPCG